MLISISANEFFSLANKKDPVKKAAVQFVDKSWGKCKKKKNILKVVLLYADIA